MNIQTDTIYIDRGGRRVGPLQPTTKRPGFPFYVRLQGKTVRTFTATGCYHSDGRESEYDLVSVAVDAPPSEPKRKDYSHDDINDLRRGVDRIWDSYRHYV